MLFATIGSLFLVSLIFKGKLISEEDKGGIVMELPPYHKPKWGHIIRATLMKAWDIFSRAFRVIAIVFNVPCTMTVAATFRENHSKKWIALSVVYYLVFSLALAFIFYHIGLLIWH